MLFYNALAKALNIDLDRLNISILSVEGLGFRVCQVFCVSFKKNFYGEGNLPIVRILYFYKLTRQSILDKHLHFIV